MRSVRALMLRRILAVNARNMPTVKKISEDFTSS